MVSTSVRRIFSNLCIRTWQQTNIFASQNNNCLVNFEVKALFSSRKASFTTICANVLGVYNFQSQDIPPSLELILKNLLSPCLVKLRFFWSLIGLPSIYISLFLLR